MSNENKKPKPAFPGRTGMGYETGLTKLEWMTVNLVVSHISTGNILTTADLKHYIGLAKSISKECAEHE